MKGWRIWIVVGVIALATVLMAGLGQAQDQGPQASAAPAAVAGKAPSALSALVGTGFTYQGRLNDVSGPVSGPCDLTFRLYDEAGSGSPPAGGTLLGTEAKPGEQLVDGLFTVTLDFGGMFYGEARWLEIEVDCGSGPQTLSPRQPVTPAPYALAMPGMLTVQNATSSTVVGGWWGNPVSGAAVGITVSGGGQSGSPNTVLSSFGTVGGGDGNTVTAEYATVGGGTANGVTATAGTIPGGSQAAASHYGELAYAGGMFANPGDAQTSTYVLRGTTTGTSWHELFLDGSGERITVPPDRALTVHALIVGRSDGGKTAGYRIWGVIENDGGTIQWVGYQVELEAEEDTGWDARLVANNDDGALSVEGKGNDETIRWVAMLHTAEVAW